MDGDPVRTAETIAQECIVEGVDHPDWKQMAGIDHPIQKAGGSNRDTVEAIDHPVQEKGSSNKNIVKGIDHPGWRQATYKTAANKEYGKIDGRHLGRLGEVESNKTCGRPSQIMMNQGTLCNLYNQHAREVTVRKAEHKPRWLALEVGAAHQPGATNPGGYAS